MTLKKTFKKLVTLGRHSFYQQGIELYNQGLFMEALEKFKTLTMSSEAESSLHYNLACFYSGLIHRNLGLLFLHKGDYAEAIGHFNMALELNPTHYEIYNYFGITYNNWKKYQKAMDSFAKVLELVPELLSLRYKVAVVLYNLKKYGEAREELQKLVLFNPTFADFHFHLGVILAHDKDFEEALKAFSSALDLNPQYLQARIQYVLTSAALGKYESAVQRLKDIIKEKSTYPDLYYYLGVIQAAQKDWKGALETIRKALEINPNYPNALLILGIFCIRNHDYPAAMEALRKALDLDLDEEQHAFATNLLDSLEKRKKKKITEDQDPAKFNLNPLQEDYLEAILQTVPQHLTIVPDYIEIMEKFGSKWDRPLLGTLARLYEEEIAKTSYYADFHYQLGKVYYRMDGWDKAIIAFSAALEINPDFYKARIHLYKTYLKVEMPEKAKKELELLIKQDIKFPDISLDLASLYWQEENWEAVLSVLETVRMANPGLEKAFLLSAGALEKKGQPAQALTVLRDFKEKNGGCSGEVSLRILELEKKQSGD